MMPTDENFSSIPIATVFREMNGLVNRGLIAEWALGGALAGIYYTEPITTYDADIFFVPSDLGLSAGIPAIYEELQSKGWRAEGEHLLVNGFPVQLLAAQGLTEDAVRESAKIEFEGAPGRVFTAEYIVAIAASVGRLKDRARIEQLFAQTTIDTERLSAILARYRLKLPAP